MSSEFYLRSSFIVWATLVATIIWSAKFILGCRAKQSKQSSESLQESLMVLLFNSAFDVKVGSGESLSSCYLGRALADGFQFSTVRRLSCSVKFSTLMARTSIWISIRSRNRTRKFSLIAEDLDRCTWTLGHRWPRGRGLGGYPTWIYRKRNLAVGSGNADDIIFDRLAEANISEAQGWR